ncbi:MAG: peptidoglycan binding protein CsiV [Gammaproteobacteria bacterium]|nr:peptidoglycan binding protein CsiV [Gammaproteobacteria bacterium]MDA7989753.1 peptidoglycan binding protein CsiV [Gammaproteobacteria bacterium]MDA8006983.1 peptidoglycan binding protein CsiV [Gammaproteobacteria bacterium]MDA8011024.1 peptidoglycan binding protein CsiV [Gammaproteobacteria bacterium]MDA8014708.1 peptidoglycan binding protein CsiV [Gammaproteobacteria bacterium]
MLRICIAALALALMPAAASGEAEEEYEIEVLVFERAAPPENAAPPERWDFSSERYRARLRRMQRLGDRASDFETINQVYRLKAARAALRASGHRIIESVSWRQKESLLQNAPLVAVGKAGPARALLEGFVRIYTTTLIYADIDMQISPHIPAAPEMRAAPRRGAPQYFISEKRRVKFGQIHYFDHPLFGVLLGVWPAPPEDEFAL